jgi:hypothetical protein
METFTEPRNFEENPRFHEQRAKSLESLDLSKIDPPVVDIVEIFSRLPYCFTMQICAGHFLYPGQRDPHNLDPLPKDAEIQKIEYRIAYLALCIADTNQGQFLFEDLRKISSIDPEYVQFGSADWFWERQVNSFALQVEPKRMMFKDRCEVDYREALHIELVIDEFFSAIRKLLFNRADGIVTD